MGQRLGLIFAWLMLSLTCVAAERTILLVTPQGVYQSTVKDGVPGPWVPFAADVIIQGFPSPKPGPTPDPPKPDPPIVDEQTKKIESISLATLKNKNEAIAVASLVNSLSKLGLSATQFRESLEMAAPIADVSLASDGRITNWVKQSLAVTADPAKLKAGVIAAFGVDPNVINAIHESTVADPSVEVTGEALNFLQIIEIIRMVLELLKNLGIGGR